MSGRLLIFTRALPAHHLGGMELMAWDLARALAHLGASVTVVTTAIAGAPGSFVEAGVAVVALAGTPPGRYSAAWWRASRRYLAAQPPAAIAAVLSVSAAGFGLPRLKRRFPHTRFIMQAHGTSWDEIRSKWRAKTWRARLSSLRNLSWLPRDLRAYQAFDTVVAVGDTVLASLASPPAAFALAPQKRRLIQNGIDTNIFRPDPGARRELRALHGVLAAAPLVISASRLHPQKGGADALRAFAQFAAGAPSARYWVAGDGPQEHALAALAQDLGIAGRVTFLGRLARPELARHLAAADAFLFLGSRVEVGLPLNVLEALAAGLPAVVSAALVAAPTLGLFPVDQRDPAAAAAQLGRVADPAAARIVALPAQFDLTACARRYLTLMLAER